MADTSATVAARAERFSRIAEIARRDVDRFSQGMYRGGVGGSGVGVWPVMDPPWVLRRKTEKMQAARKKKQEHEEDKNVEKVVAIALEMGEQVGAMKLQLEEQSRQLKTLAIGHQNQTSLQQQLVSLLNTVHESKPKLQAPKSHVISRPPVCTSNQGQTPQEYHTLTWLNSQKHIGKQEKLAGQGYKPGTRKTGFFNSEHRYESGSDRTKTTFGGTRRRFAQRSVCSVPTERSAGMDPESRKDVKVLDNDGKKSSAQAKNTKQMPLVTALYAKCKRRQQKRLPKLEKKSLSEVRKPSTPRCDRQVAEATAFEHLKEHHATECAKPVQREESILESMLSVHKYEDELKLRWLVPDVNKQERDIGKSIMDEMLNYRTGMTPRIQAAVQNTVEKQWPKKQQPQQQKDHRDEWILEDVMDDVLKDICCELLSFCDEFVEHMYMSEFLRLDDGT